MTKYKLDYNIFVHLPAASGQFNNMPESAAAKTRSHMQALYNHSV